MELFHGAEEDKYINNDVSPFNEGALMRLTVNLTTYKRPWMARRMLTHIAMQTMLDVELFFLGDCCPEFDKIVCGVEFIVLWEKLQKNGGKVYIYNDTEHRGMPGTLLNYAIPKATGEYFIFLGDDDSILPDHFENYYKAINDPSPAYDVVFMPSIIDLPNPPFLFYRYPEMHHGGVGHSEMIIDTEKLKQAPQHNNIHGHDWDLIAWLMNNSRYAVRNDVKPTYIVRGLVGNRLENR